jgi:hypothetical protein
VNSRSSVAAAPAAACDASASRCGSRPKKNATAMSWKAVSPVERATTTSGSGPAAYTLVIACTLGGRRATLRESIRVSVPAP